MKTAVIGSGIGGMAAAIRMAAKGHQVTVYEKNDRPGGKIGELRMAGFRFDTGPSLFTLPELAEELFALCGEEMSGKLPYGQLDINCRYFYPDGTTFDFYRDPSRLEKETEEKTKDSPAALFRRLSKAAETYRLGAPVFLFTSFRRLSDFNTAPYKKMALRLYKLDFFRTMHRANSKDFRDPRLVRIFDRYATYNGSDPYRAPATLNMIAHLENNIGAFFPQNGMYAIAEELYRLALRQGVRFRFGAPVTEILTAKKNERAAPPPRPEKEKHISVADNAYSAPNIPHRRPGISEKESPDILEQEDVRKDGMSAEEKGPAGFYAAGLRTPSGTEYYDLIISDIDVKQVSRTLLPKHPLGKRLERQEPSTSALIFYWGINRRFPALDIHNILFSDDYREEFRKLFREKDLSDDPTVYIFISSKKVMSDAPAGCENWFVMVNAPADRGQNWETLAERARKNILRKIERTLGTDPGPHIVAEAVAKPTDIALRTGSIHGSLYGASSNSMFSAFLRHPNFLHGIRNLYFVGGSVHPGGGIPLCLAGAKIVEQEICRSYA